MFQEPGNFLQFHENTFISPLNLINVMNPTPRQSIDSNKLEMYQFLVERKLKEDRRKQEVEQKPTPPVSRRSNSSQARTKPTTPRATSVPKKTFVPPKKVIRNQNSPPPPILYQRPLDPVDHLPPNRQNELKDMHENLLIHLRHLHNPSTRENIIDETDQEKQRRLRMKRERIKHDARAIYHAHLELKKILQELRESDANQNRLFHRHLSAYKAIVSAVEALAQEAPIKKNDTPVQQLLNSVLPILETLLHVNHALGLTNCQIDPTYLRLPELHRPRTPTASTSAPLSTNKLLPSIYQELMKKKQQKQRKIPSVLRERPRSAENDRQNPPIERPTISSDQKSRTKSQSPRPSTVETNFHSKTNVDKVLVKLTPHLVRRFEDRELNEQIERARILTPMFLTDNRLTEEEIVDRILQMLTPFKRAEDSAEDEKQPIDLYQQQISQWDDEMAAIRQRVQNYRTNVWENETKRQEIFPISVERPKTVQLLPEHVQIHRPLFQEQIDDVPVEPNETSFVAAFERGKTRLKMLDANKVRQIERYRRDYEDFLRRTESAAQGDFDPQKIIERMSESFLNQALITVAHELETLTDELSEKLVGNELLGHQISLDVVKSEEVRRRRHVPLSPVDHHYNSSFEEDVRTESRSSRSKSAPKRTIGRQSPMRMTGPFTSDFRSEISQRDSSSSSSSSPRQTDNSRRPKPTTFTSNASNSHESKFNTKKSRQNSETSSSNSPTPQFSEHYHKRSPRYPSTPSPVYENDFDEDDEQYSSRESQRAQTISDEDDKRDALVVTDYEVIRSVNLDDPKGSLSMRTSYSNESEISNQ